MIATLLGLSRAAKRAARRQTFRPRLEVLEDRCLLAGGVTLTLTSATVANGSTTIRGTLHGAPSTTYSGVEFFSGAGCSTTTTFLGIDDLTTDGGGDVRTGGTLGFVETFPTVPAAGEDSITGIGNGFTGCTQVSVPVTPTLTLKPTSDVARIGQSFQVTAKVLAGSAPVVGMHLTFEVDRDGMPVSLPSSVITSGDTLTGGYFFFRYSEPTAGDDTIKVTASGTAPDGSPFSAMAVTLARWIDAAPCSLTPETGSSFLTHLNQTVSLNFEVPEGTPITFNIADFDPTTGEKLRENTLHVVTDARGPQFTYNVGTATPLQVVTATGQVDGKPFVCRASYQWIDALPTLAITGIQNVDTGMDGRNYVGLGQDVIVQATLLRHLGTGMNETTTPAAGVLTLEIVNGPHAPFQIMANTNAEGIARFELTDRRFQQSEGIDTFVVRSTITLVPGDEPIALRTPPQELNWQGALGLTCAIYSNSPGPVKPGPITTLGAAGTVGATVRFNHEPVNGRTVNFDVVEGPNRGNHYSGTTDANGNATIGLGRTQTVGRDVVVASALGAPDSVPCGTTTFDWVPSTNPGSGDDVVAFLDADTTTGIGPVTVRFAHIEEAPCPGVCRDGPFVWFEPHGSDDLTQPAPLHNGFSFGEPRIFFDVKADARITGPIEVCVVYDPDIFRPGSITELLHGEGGQWKNRTSKTVPFGFPTHYQICAQVDSLSPFAVVGAQGAGNVTAQIAKGRLLIQGDNSGNYVQIEAGAAGAGSIRITGVGTLVNGQRGPAEFSRVTKGIQITTGTGNDTVVFDGTSAALAIRGAVDLSTSDGDDTIQFLSMTVRGALQLDSGTGADTVEVIDSLLSGGKRDLGILTGAGADTVRLNHSRLEGHLLADAGSENDSVALIDSVIALNGSRRGGARRRAPQAPPIVISGGLGDLDTLDAGILSDPNSRRNELDSRLSVDGFENQLS